MTIPLDALDLDQQARVRCLEVACALLGGCQVEVRLAVAQWLYMGEWELSADA